jgi:hypothetical protein
MEKIYEGQDFPIEVIINDNLTGATNLKLNVKRSEAILPQLTPTVVDATQGRIIYLASNNEFNVAGQYTIWVTYTDINGLDQVGQPFVITIFKQGT